MELPTPLASTHHLFRDSELGRLAKIATDLLATMATTSPAQTLSLGVLATFPDPTAQYGAPAAIVQVQNASPFIITVTIDGETHNIQSFTAQTLPTAGSGASMLVLPTTGPAGTQGTLTPVWLNAGEPPPMADGQLTGAAQYAQGLGSQLYQGAGSIGSLAIPPTTRTLLIALQAFVNGSWPSLTIVGNQSGFDYYNQPLYLKAGGANQNYLAVVPIPALLDKNVSIVTTSTASFIMSVFADTAQYDESVFYNNGTVTSSAQAVTAATAGLTAGPCRLLTAAVIAGTNLGYIEIGATPILYAATATAESLSVPAPGIIIPSGVTVSVVSTAGTANGTVNTAYP